METKEKHLEYWRGQVHMAKCILNFVDWETEHISKEEVKHRIEALMQTNLDLIEKVKNSEKQV